MDDGSVDPAAVIELAVYQGNGRMADVPGNLAIIRRIAGETAQQGSDLVVFPEMFLTGYNIGRSVVDLAEPAGGPGLEALCEIAREASIAIVCGYPEKSGSVLYNAAIAIGKDGEAVANYRKCHLFGQFEADYFTAGDTFVCCEIAGVKIGILICYDIEFPEPARVLALRGAEVLIVPTALMAPALPVTRRVVPARACENQVFVAYANRPDREADLEYVGESCIVGPDGEDMARAGQAEGLLYATADINALRASREKYDYLSERRCQLYAEVLRESKTR